VGTLKSPLYKGDFYGIMVEINNRTKSHINLLLAKKVAEKFLRAYKKIGYEVSIVFVGDSVIRRLNKTYRSKDKITDVLAFKGEGKFLGEIIIDYAQIKRQASRYGNSVQSELIFILVHGLLHLIGLKDETAKGKKEMKRAGAGFIKKLKYL
jgi:rRNA maturation RNase YbeY